MFIIFRVIFLLFITSTFFACGGGGGGGGSSTATGSVTTGIEPMISIKNMLGEVTSVSVYMYDDQGKSLDKTASLNIAPHTEEPINLRLIEKTAYVVIKNSTTDVIVAFEEVKEEENIVELSSTSQSKATEAQNYIAITETGLDPKNIDQPVANSTADQQYEAIAAAITRAQTKAVSQKTYDSNPEFEEYLKTKTPQILQDMEEEVEEIGEQELLEAYIEGLEKGGMIDIKKNKIPSPWIKGVNIKYQEIPEIISFLYEMGIGPTLFNIPPNVNQIEVLMALEKADGSKITQDFLNSPSKYIRLYKISLSGSTRIKLTSNSFQTIAQDQVDSLLFGDSTIVKAGQFILNSPSLEKNSLYVFHVHINSTDDYFSSFYTSNFDFSEGMFTPIWKLDVEAFDQFLKNEWGIEFKDIGLSNLGAEKKLYFTFNYQTMIFNFGHPYFGTILVPTFKEGPHGFDKIPNSTRRDYFSNAYVLITPTPILGSQYSTTKYKMIYKIPASMVEKKLIDRLKRNPKDINLKPNLNPMISNKDTVVIEFPLEFSGAHFYVGDVGTSMTKEEYNLTNGFHPCRSDDWTIQLAGSRDRGPSHADIILKPDGSYLTNLPHFEYSPYSDSWSWSLAGFTTSEGRPGFTIQSRGNALYKTWNAYESEKRNRAVYDEEVRACNYDYVLRRLKPFSDLETAYIDKHNIEFLPLPSLLMPIEVLERTGFETVGLTIRYDIPHDLNSLAPEQRKLLFRILIAPALRHIDSRSEMDGYYRSFLDKVHATHTVHDPTAEEKKVITDIFFTSEDNINSFENVTLVKYITGYLHAKPKIWTALQAVHSYYINFIEESKKDSVMLEDWRGWLLFMVSEYENLEKNLPSIERNPFSQWIKEFRAANLKEWDKNPISLSAYDLEDAQYRGPEMLNKQLKGVGHMLVEMFIGGFEHLTDLRATNREVERTMFNPLISEREKHLKLGVTVVETIGAATVVLGAAAKAPRVAQALQNAGRRSLIDGTIQAASHSAESLKTIKFINYLEEENLLTQSGKIIQRTKQPLEAAGIRTPVNTRIAAFKEIEETAQPIISAPDPTRFTTAPSVLYRGKNMDMTIDEAVAIMKGNKVAPKLQASYRVQLHMKRGHNFEEVIKQVHASNSIRAKDRFIKTLAKKNQGDYNPSRIRGALEESAPHHGADPFLSTSTDKDVVDFFVGSDRRVIIKIDPQKVKTVNLDAYADDIKKFSGRYLKESEYSVSGGIKHDAILEMEIYKGGKHINTIERLPDSSGFRITDVVENTSKVVQ